MNDILLIHGAWHGGWCWDATADALRNHGWRVACPDIQGTALTDCAASLPWAPVVLGHSMGGMLAEAMIPPPRALIHLCSYLPLPGDSLAALDRLLPGAPRGWPRDERGYLILPPDAARRMITDGADPKTVARALSLLRPQHPGPMRDPLPGPRANISRHYVLCGQDRAISPDLQCAMLKRAPVDHLHTTDWGHAPYLSDPAGLAALIHRIAQRHLILPRAAQ